MMNLTKKQYIIDRTQTISSFLGMVSEEMDEVEGMDMYLIEKGRKLSK